jgi:hypothetical protein
MIHVGADLHERFCYMTALDATGRKLKAGAVVNRALELRRWLRDLPRPVSVAVEACSFWPAFYERSRGRWKKFGWCIRRG